MLQNLNTQVTPNVLMLMEICGIHIVVGYNSQILQFVSHPFWDGRGGFGNECQPKPTVHHIPESSWQGQGTAFVLPGADASSQLSDHCGRTAGTCIGVGGWPAARGLRLGQLLH